MQERLHVFEATLTSKEVFGIVGVKRQPRACAKHIGQSDAYAYINGVCMLRDFYPCLQSYTECMCNFDPNFHNTVAGQVTCECQLTQVIFLNEPRLPFVLFGYI